MRYVPVRETILMNGIPVPVEFIDPLTQKIMTFPVEVEGRFYDSASRYNRYMTDDQIARCYAFGLAIQAFLMANSSLLSSEFSSYNPTEVHKVIFPIPIYDEIEMWIAEGKFDYLERYLLLHLELDLSNPEGLKLFRQALSLGNERLVDLYLNHPKSIPPRSCSLEECRSLNGKILLKMLAAGVVNVEAEQDWLALFPAELERDFYTEVREAQRLGATWLKTQLSDATIQRVYAYAALTTPVQLKTECAVIGVRNAAIPALLYMDPHKVFAANLTRIKVKQAEGYVPLSVYLAEHAASVPISEDSLSKIPSKIVAPFLPGRTGWSEVREDALRIEIVASADPRIKAFQVLHFSLSQVEGFCDSVLGRGVLSVVLSSVESSPGHTETQAALYVILEAHFLMLSELSHDPIVLGRVTAGVNSAASSFLSSAFSILLSHPCAQEPDEVHIISEEERAESPVASAAVRAAAGAGEGEREAGARRSSASPLNVFGERTRCQLSEGAATAPGISQGDVRIPLESFPTTQTAGEGEGHEVCLVFVEPGGNNDRRPESFGLAGAGTEGHDDKTSEDFVLPGAPAGLTG